MPLDICKDPQKCFLKIHMGVKKQTLILILNFKKGAKKFSINTAFFYSEPISKSLTEKYFFMSNEQKQQKEI